MYRRAGRLTFKLVEHYLVTAPAGTHITPQTGEIDEAVWLTIDEAIARASFADTRTALAAARTALGGSAALTAAPPGCLQSSHVQLFDTATEALATLTPRDGRVGIYVCGITPYDGGHLGHAFTYHTFDVIARRLWADGVDVRSVRNVTDVDDDILRVARERGIDYRVLGDRETLRFDRDMADLGLLDVDASPRASNRVPEMVDWISRLVGNGAAYEVRGLGVLRRRALPAIWHAQRPRHRHHDAAVAPARWQS